MRRRVFLSAVGAAGTGALGLASVGADVRSHLGSLPQLGRTGPTGSTEDREPGAGDEPALTRRYPVVVDGRSETLPVRLPRALYEAYANRPRHDRYLAYATDSRNAAVVDRVVASIGALAGEDATRPTVRRAATRFVQDLSYVRDREIGYAEYPKYPVETLVEGAGDCEDTAILLAGLLDSLGFDAALLILWEADHMAVGIAGPPGVDGTGYPHDGSVYYYLESVEPGWSVGSVPSNYTDVAAEVRPVRLDPTG